MAMVAPIVVRGAATKAAAGAATKKAATGAVQKKAATAAATRTAAVPTGTAAARANQLRASGASRPEALRALKDEFGGTAAESGDLFDAAATPPAPPTSSTDPSSSSSSGPLLPKVPKSIGAAATAGGGALLGAIGYVLALTYLRDGKAGVTRWLRAKFLNEVSP